MTLYGYDGGGSFPGVPVGIPGRPQGVPTSGFSGGGVRVPPPIADSPVTPTVISARYATATRPNPFELIGHVAAGIDENERWKDIVVDRPTIMFPVFSRARPAVGSAYAVQNLGGPIVYHPDYRPDATNATLGVPFANCLVSFGPGVCYLSAPGKWWLNYTAVAATGITLERDCPRAYMLQIPCEDPALAAVYLSEPGETAIRPGFAISDAVAGTVTTILAANPRRRGLTIMSTANGSDRIIIGLDFDPVADTVTPDYQGYILVNNGSLTLSGSNNHRGEVRVAATAASKNVSWIETE